MFFFNWPLSDEGQDGEEGRSSGRGAPPPLLRGMRLGESVDSSEIDTDDEIAAVRRV